MWRAPPPSEFLLGMSELLLARVSGDVAFESIIPELDVLPALASTPAKYDLKLAGSSVPGKRRSMASAAAGILLADEELALRSSRSAALLLGINNDEAVDPTPDTL